MTAAVPGQPGQPESPLDIAKRWLDAGQLVHYGWFVGQVTAWIDGPTGVLVKLNSTTRPDAVRVVPPSQCCSIGPTITRKVADD